MARRTRYQQGSVQRGKRRNGPGVWVFRWREIGSDGKSLQRKAVIGTVINLPSEASAAQSSPSVAHRRQPTNPASSELPEYGCRIDRTLSVEGIDRRRSG